MSCCNGYWRIKHNKHHGCVTKAAHTHGRLSLCTSIFHWDFLVGITYPAGKRALFGITAVSIPLPTVGYPVLQLAIRLPCAGVDTYGRLYPAIRLWPARGYGHDWHEILPKGFLQVLRYWWVMHTARLVFSSARNPCRSMPAISVETIRASLINRNRSCLSRSFI